MTTTETSPDLASSATHFLNGLIGKCIAVTLVGQDRPGQDFVGVLTRIYTDAILLTRQGTEQLIFLRAIATVQEAPGRDREFLASIANVQATTNADYQALAKYVGE